MRAQTLRTLALLCFFDRYNNSIIAYNNPAEYQAGRPIPRVAYQQTQKISDDLRMFIKRVMLPINSDGMMNHPDDYMHFSKATYRYLS